MTDRKPLVVIAGQVQELPAGDSISGLTAQATSNVIGAATAIATDTSYIVASYLTVTSDLTISGNLMVTG